MFLDEPTIGLDPVVKKNVRELIRQMNREEHTTIFLTSHDVGDIEKLCSRIIIVNDGQIVLDDSVPAAGGCGRVHVSGDPVTLGARGGVLRAFAHSVRQGVFRFLLYFIIPVGMAVWHPVHVLVSFDAGMLSAVLGYACALSAAAERLIGNLNFLLPISHRSW